MLPVRNFYRNLFSTTKIYAVHVRSVFLSLPRQLKEIRSEQTDKNLIISGSIVPSPREPFMIETENNACPICSLGLQIKHTETLILSQFVRSDGRMLPRRVTGLCRKEQKRMSSLVAMAHKAGLMSNLNPQNSKNDPKKRYRWKKYNTYFDESTIKT